MANYLSDEEVISYLDSIGVPREKFICKDCGKVVRWKDTVFNFPTRKLKNPDTTGKSEFKDLLIRGTSFANKRIYNGHEYHLSYCYKCACKRYPEIPDKKFPLQPASFRSKVLYCISDEDFDDVVDNISRRTEENYIKKFGEEEGLKRWKIYCEKQAYTNSFEHKQKKYGWTKEEYDKFNTSRSCTLKHFIERHGEEDGLIMWENYRERQRYTNTLEYFKEKYGDKEGQLKYNIFSKKRALSGGAGKPYSDIANEMFEKISKYFENDKIWTYGNNNGEFMLNYRYLLDFYDETKNFVIEFYGDYWHANSEIFESTHKFSHGQSMKDIHENDEKRKSYIENVMNTKMFIVWEHDYRKDKEKCVENIVNEINEYLKSKLSS